MNGQDFDTVAECYCFVNAFLQGSEVCQNTGLAMFIKLVSKCSLVNFANF